MCSQKHRFWGKPHRGGNAHTGEDTRSPRPTWREIAAISRHVGRGDLYVLFYENMHYPPCTTTRRVPARNER